MIFHPIVVAMSLLDVEISQGPSSRRLARSRHGGRPGRVTSPGSCPDTPGGNAVKAVQPLLETTVIGIDVLDMDGTLDAHACVQVDGIVGNLRFLRKVAIGRVACPSPVPPPWPARSAVRRPAWPWVICPRPITPSSVCPLRSRATRTHTSSLDKPALPALAPRRRAVRPALRPRRKRCRQRSAVLR